jgi:stage V sporulation protein G
MEITEVRVTLREEPRLKAFVNVTFDNDFVIRGMKVIEGRNGLFVAMPSRRSKDGTFRDIAHPINNEMRKRLEEIVLEEYYKKCKEEGKEPATSSLEQEEFETPEEAEDLEIEDSETDLDLDVAGEEAEAGETEEDILNLDVAGEEAEAGETEEDILDLDAAGEEAEAGEIEEDIL